jgi:glycine/D-amino acid oxidase-like deaminating enzyme
VQVSIDTCLYTMSPDEDFIIDFHPTNANIVIAAGFSGHGFKFGGMVGRILADLAVYGRTSYDISPFSAQRASLKI